MRNKINRITVLIMFMFSFCPLLAQENNIINKIISISLKDVTQEEALEHLIKVHGIQLAYSNTFLSKEKKVSIMSESISIRNILNTILEGTNLKVQSADGNSIIIAPDKNTGGNNNSIKGKIIDVKTGEPLISASVFLNGTTFGKATDKNGNYEIKRIPMGQYELAVSMLGYGLEKRTVALKGNTELVMNVSLAEKDIEIKPIEIAGVRPKEWYENMEIFKRALIGKSDFAEKCKIVNEEDVYFIENKEDSTFEAQTVKPLRIINNALGYKLECFITRLSYNRNKREVLITSITNFEEMQTTDEDSLEEWQENREEAFKGSVVHFLVSLTKGKARSEGFYTYEDVCRFIKNYNINDREITMKPQGEISEEIFISYLPDNKEYFFNTNRIIVEYKRNISAFDVVSKEMCLDENGYPKGDALYKVAGKWAEKGIADLLPRFYEKIFEKDKK